MARTFPIQANFSRGEASPKLHARVDVEFYRAMLKSCTNWTVMKQGGLRRRPSFLMVKEVKDSSKSVRLIPFIFGTPSGGIPQAYVIEAGNLYFRYITNGGIITDLGGTPTAATAANPGVFTLAGHGLTNGDKVYATGFLGLWAVLNNREFTVAGVAGNDWNIGVDTSAFGAYSVGGFIKKVVETVTTYLEADLQKLDHAQTADKLTVTHLDYQAKDYTRTSDTQWTATNVVFKDGPYLDEPVDNAVLVTLSATNSIVPLMTSNVLPSGTVTGGDAGADAFEVFDQNAVTTDAIGIANASWAYDLAGAATAVVNNYWIRVDGEQTNRAPSTWVFQGFDGASWVDLDAQANQTSWGGGETRYFDFVNAIAYQAYRIVVTGTAGTAGTVEIAEMGWGYNGDFGPTITATFSALTDINDGAGFSSPDDIGRNIRFRGSDGKWRYMIITGVTSTLIVTGRIYGYAFPNLSAISRWRLGSFRGGSWPSKVGYYQSRRVFARSIKQPYNVWFSQTFGFTSFGVSSPVLDDDAISVAMLTGQVNGVMWLDDAESLAVGTTDNVRLIGKANQSLGFGASNFDHQTKSYVGTKEIKPVKVQNVLLYSDEFGRTLREFIYDFNTDGYVAPDITVLSDHLFKPGLVQMAYQKNPDSIVWCVMTDGSLVAVTYEREQKIVGITNCPVAIGDPGTTAIVESVCCIPGTMRTEVYISVKRTIGGVTKRFIERLAPEFEYGLLADAAVGVDMAMQYSGAATNVVYGAWHLIGQVVNVLADGAVFRAITVAADGTVTLPGAVTAEKWTLGKGYRSFGETLELASITPDGVHIGRRKLTGELYVSVMAALGLVMKGITAAASVDLFKRDNILDPPAGAMALREGVFPTRFDQSWRDGGRFQFYVDDPLPCIIRGFIIGAEGEP